MNHRYWPSGTLFLAALLFGCNSQKFDLSQPTPSVGVAHPLAEKITDYDEYTGQIKAVDSVEVRSRVRGHLERIYFEDGAYVKKGDLLFLIDPKPFEAAYEQAKAQNKAAEAALKLGTSELARVRVLFAKGASSREELDTAVAKEQVSAAEVGRTRAAGDSAKLDLDYTRIHAPIDGVISRHLVSVGNLINSAGQDTVLTSIVSVEPMHVYFKVDQRSLLRYQRLANEAAAKGKKVDNLKELNVPVHVALADENDYLHKGTLEFGDNQVDPGTGTIALRGVLPNKDELLVAGMTCRVRIPIGDPYGALLVSERALAWDQDRRYLLIVNADNVLERRAVKLGPVLDGMQVVRDGLKASDWVVYSGLQRVQAGIKVLPTQGKMPLPADWSATPRGPEVRKPKPVEVKPVTPDKK